MRALWSDRPNCSHNRSQKVKRIRRFSDSRGCCVCVTVRLPVRPRAETVYWQANVNTLLSVTPPLKPALRCPNRNFTIAAISNRNQIVRFVIAECSAKSQPNRLKISGCRERSAAKGVRSLFFVFGTLSVTFRSLFLTLLSLFSSLFCRTPFAGLLLRQAENLLRSSVEIAAFFLALISKKKPCEFKSLAG